MLNNWNQENFNYDGGYLHYTENRKQQFVARFKNGGMVAFKKFLRNNFTPVEYFQAQSEGKTPLKILELKGYISPNVYRVLKNAGYPATIEGKASYFQDLAETHKSQ